ncbi:MAG: DUF3108 domain-containing protein [Deltaproteobacteria bacterium]|nr:DUF3108 domain-containing protein [Deltaproteobacteria bacterium]
MGNGNLKLGMGHLLMWMILLLFGSLPAYGGEQARVLNPENGAEKTFHYVAKKLGLPILKATIRIGNGYSGQGKNLHKIEAQVISLKVPGFMFRMNNRFTSVLEMSSFSPMRYVKKIDQEGLFIQRKNYSETITFDSILHKATIEKKVTGEKREVFFPSQTYDPLAMFARYHLREDLSPDQEVRMSIFDGIKFREMVFHSKRSRVKSKVLGEVDAVCLESTTAFSSFGEKEGNIRIWYTADVDKIPISLELDLPVGMVRFELEGIREG